MSWLGSAVAHGPGIRPVTGACLIALSLGLITVRRLTAGLLVGRLRWLLPIALTGAALVAARLLWQLFLGGGTPQRASSPHTVIAMVILGSGLVLSINADGLRRRIAVLCALSGAVITWLALLGYATTMPMFFSVPGDPTTGMSVVTAVALMTISVGIMGLFPEHGFVALFHMKSDGGTLMRVLLPAAVLFPLLAGGLLNHGYNVGWFRREVGLALNLSVTSIIVISLVLSIGLAFKRREAEQLAAEEERELLLRSLRTSLDELSKLQTNLVTVCAWTQRVLDEGKWVRLEEFLEKRLNISITHGISDGAADAELQSLEDWMNQSSDVETPADLLGPRRPPGL